MEQRPTQGQSQGQTLEQYRIEKLEEELKALKAQLDAWEKRTSRTIELYEAEREDNVQVSRAIKIAIGTMLGSALVTGLIIPIVSHFLK